MTPSLDIAVARYRPPHHWPMSPWIRMKAMGPCSVSTPCVSTNPTDGKALPRACCEDTWTLSSRLLHQRWMSVLFARNLWWEKICLKNEIHWFNYLFRLAFFSQSISANADSFLYPSRILCDGSIPSCAWQGSLDRDDISFRVKSSSFGMHARSKRCLCLRSLRGSGCCWPEFLEHFVYGFSWTSITLKIE